MIEAWLFLNWKYKCQCHKHIKCLNLIVQEVDRSKMCHIYFGILFWKWPFISKANHIKVRIICISELNYHQWFFISNVFSNFHCDTVTFIALRLPYTNANDQFNSSNHLPPLRTLEGALGASTTGPVQTRSPETNLSTMCSVS